MIQPPSLLFPGLFEAVQRAALFADSKTFADAIPRRDPAAIMADWNRAPPADVHWLSRFVVSNFELPEERPDVAQGDAALVDYIDGLWSRLTKPPVEPVAGQSALPLAHRHVVPGGRFRELYYWDSYFTMLGLAQSGRQDLVEEMIATFGDLLDRYGMIPNGSRSYYLSRSHPPVFYLMASLSCDETTAAQHRRLGWMLTEHRFWMAGGADVTIGCAHRRVVRLADGTLLNRYWDDRAEPRDESWREDMALAAANPQRSDEDLWRDLRAGAESGWDFSSRWLTDPAALGSIHTTDIIPIDLNCLLYGLERAIAAAAASLGEKGVVRDFTDRAATRRAAIEQILWNEQLGCHADYDWRADRVLDRLTGASAFALFCRVTRPDRARSAARALKQLLRPGGLVATTVSSGQQWDAPNGWAPLQWVAVDGLRAYGEHELAERISANWVAMVEARFRETGLLLEKYDVEHCREGGGGEYPAVTGFGWTNGVTLALLGSEDGRSAVGQQAAE